LSETEQLQENSAEDITSSVNRELTTLDSDTQLENYLHMDSRNEQNRGALWAAIRARRVVEFDNLKNHHVVEPFALGITLLGNPDNEAIICYKIGGSEDFRQTGWRLYRIPDIQNLKIRKETFTGERPGYDPDKIDMQKVFICVRLPKTEKKAPELLTPPRIESVTIPLSSPPPPSPAAPPPKPKAPQTAPLTHNMLMHRFRMTHPAQAGALKALLMVRTHPLTHPQKA
jgi:hypothetical protein